MDQVDVLVVGGGCAGVYTAWRLATAEAGMQVRLVEQSDHVGGRLDSPRPPGMPHLVAEFGGMGWTDAHTLVAGAVQELGLETWPFPDSPDAYGLLRGVFLEGAQIDDPAAIPYRLTAAEAAALPVAKLLVTFVGDDIGQDPTTVTHAQWVALGQTHVVEPYGVRLGEIGFWNYLSALLSPEGYAYVRDVLAHQFIVGNYNAVDMLEWFFADFASTKYTWLRDGYQTLPLAIAARAGQAGADIRLGNGAVRVEAGATAGTLVVTLQDGSAVQAAHVVLALPQRAIELISPGSVVLNEPPVQALLGSVEALPVMKIFLAYETPWWTQGNGTPNDQPPGVWGKSVSTLPLKRTYYFGEEEAAPDGEPGNTSSLLMASYDDALALTFWEGLRDGDDYPLTPTKWTTFSGDALWHQQAATVAMVNAAQAQVAALHQWDPEFVPAPYAAAFRDWRDDPFGGATHAWRVGVSSDDVMSAIIQPDPSTPLYVVGEAYSRQQGWVEGAFETAETMLQRVFSLPPPPWA